MSKYVIDSAEATKAMGTRLQELAVFLTDAMNSLEEARKHISGYISETREARDRLVEEIAAIEARLGRGIEQ
jgi:predicted  nucleic acid-binding Zn-ribbon protein